MKRYLVCLVAFLILFATYCQELPFNGNTVDIPQYLILSHSNHGYTTTPNLRRKLRTQLYQLSPVPGVDYRRLTMYPLQSSLSYRSFMDINQQIIFQLLTGTLQRG